MKSIHKNALALSSINKILMEFGFKPSEYIKDYDQSVFVKAHENIDTWNSSENLIRDLKLLANEYYRRINK